MRSKLDITVDELDKQRSLRLGPINKRSLRSNMGNASRPIIVRFTFYKKRPEVYKSKRNLKGQGIVISENLTQNRYKIHQAAIAKFDRKTVWTSDGRVFSEINGKIIIIITNIKVLDEY